MTEYDPDTCITAKELREAGAIGVPDDVPDCAWVPKRAVRVDDITFPIREGDDERMWLRMNIHISFTEPFRWVDLTLTFDSEGGDP